MCDLNHNHSERPARIGAKRREEYEDYLISKCDQAITWWLNTFREVEELKGLINTPATTISKNNNNQIHDENEVMRSKCLETIEKLVGQIYLCYSAWLRIFDEENVNESFPIIDAAFKHLSDLETSDDIHKYAVEVVVATSGFCEDNRMVDYLINDLVEKVFTLEPAFKQSINNEDIEKLSHFIKTFTSVAETACLMLVIEKKDFRLVELMLSCLNHYDFELVEETFNFWWTFIELVHNRVSDFAPYVPYIGRFMMAMTKLYQFDPDEETVVPADQDIHNFRLNSAELITRVMFVTSFKDFIRDNLVLEHFQAKLSDVPWERHEAMLYLVSCLFLMTTSSENETRLKLLRTIMEQQNCLHTDGRIEFSIGTQNGKIHPQIVATTLDLLGKLNGFYEEHPIFLTVAINYILQAISDDRYRNVLIKSAAAALSNIMALNIRNYMSECPSLPLVIRNLCADLDRFDETAAGDLLKCSVYVATSITEAHDQDQFMLEILYPILNSLEKLLVPPKRNDNEPVKYLDRLSSIFSQCNIHPSRLCELKNFINFIDTQLWPDLMKVLEIYASEKGQIIEKTCRTIRYIIRCVKPKWMIERVAETMINLYKTYPQNSSPIYICSILVDEFANITPEINQGLFAMLDIFCTMTFTLLEMTNLTTNPQASPLSSTTGTMMNVQQSSKSLLNMKNYPETVDDMMRLFYRFMKKCPAEFSKFKALESIIELSICSLRIDHQEANSNVTRFLNSFIELGRQSQEYSHINDAIRNVLGARITDAVIRASLFDLPQSQISEEAQLLLTLNSFDRNLFSTWIDASVEQLPKTNIQGIECVSMEQLQDFKDSLKKAESVKRMYNTLRAHARLYI